MRLFGVIVVLAILAGGATAPGAVAQTLRPFPIESLELKAPVLRVAASSAELRRQLDRAHAQFRSAGCRHAFWPRARRHCQALRSRIGALERQLSGTRASERRQRGAPSAAARYSRRTFRTICVRVCDGYYYSLSHTASRRRFEKDAERCAGQYPPGEAVLFYHPFPGDDVSQARSLDGKRYADQEYAFAFRKAYVPHCVARLHRGLTALKERVYAAVPTLLGESDPVTDGAATEPVPVALARPDRSSDPETLANRAGGLVPEPVEPQVADVAMRTVGDPSYFSEGNPGPPPTVPGYAAPELKDFRVTETSALETPPRVPGRAGDAPLGGAY